jgi:general secretion pathway protein L
MRAFDKVWNWIDRLALLLLRIQELRRARRPLSVVPRNGAFVICDGEMAQGRVLCEFSAHQPPSSEVVQATQQGFVVLELPPQDVLVAHMSVPAQAGAFLEGVVRNQIDRLSPWRANDVNYGYSAQPNEKQSGLLNVRLFIARSAAMDAMRQALTGLGLSLDRIVVRDPGDAASEPVVIWERLADAAIDDLRNARRRVTQVLAACVALSLVLSVWMVLSAQSIQERSAELTASNRALQRQMQTSAAVPAAGIEPARAAWHLKETAPSAVMTLESLSRALPDAAYVKEFDLQNDVLRISGLTSDAPLLVSALEDSGYFTDVHFFAPTTRTSDDKFAFHIEGRVKSDLLKAEE